MSYDLYQKWGFTELLLVGFKIKVADQHLVQPLGVVPYVPVKIADIRYAISFVVLDLPNPKGSAY